MCPKLIELLSWNGPTVHVYCFMLARASTKTFVSRVQKGKKIVVSRKIRYQGHSLAEVSLYFSFEQNFTRRCMSFVSLTCVLLATLLRVRPRRWKEPVSPKRPELLVHTDAAWLFWRLQPSAFSREGVRTSNLESFDLFSLCWFCIATALCNLHVCTAHDWRLNICPWCVCVLCSTRTHHGQICCHNTDYVHINGHEKPVTVILAKHCVELPDDGSLVIRNMLEQF